MPVNSRITACLLLSTSVTACGGMRDSESEGQLQQAFTPILTCTNVCTFTVTNTNDSGSGSLREAIESANAAVGTKRIVFDISGDGPHVIQPDDSLPFVDGPLTLDGYSQPGAQRGSDTSSPDIRIVLDGSQSWGNDGLFLTGDVTVSGLSIVGWDSCAIHAILQDNVIVGNYLGVDASGAATVPGSYCGVIAFAANQTHIGGTEIFERNVIGGNIVGIVLNGNDNRVQGNAIGTNFDGTLPLPNEYGVELDMNGSLVGGKVSEAANLIAYNTADGIRALGGAGNRIRRNLFYGNGELPIDLNDDGLTPNDAFDADQGPNDLQNRPILTAATIAAPGQASVSFAVSSVVGDFVVEFFSSSTCPKTVLFPGDAERFLGAEQLQTDPFGQFSGSVTLKGVTPGTAVSATATNLLTGNTSEFSNCIVVL